MQTWPLWVFAVATVTRCPTSWSPPPLGRRRRCGGGDRGHRRSRCVPCGPRSSAGVAPGCCRDDLARRCRCSGDRGWRRPRRYPVVVVACRFVWRCIPGIRILLLHGIGSRASQSAGKAVLPRRSWGSLAVLGLGAGIVLLLNQPHTAFDGQPASAQANWAARLGLPAGEQFSFIQRYLGPHATFARHAVPSIPGLPEAAVDVITTNNLAALRTYRDALWYPATVPPNYQPLELGDPAVVEGRAAATDSSLATDPHVPDWYVVTWLWRTDAAYQQIFVVVNQTWTSKAAPPGARAVVDSRHRHRSGAVVGASTGGSRHQGRSGGDSAGAAGRAPRAVGGVQGMGELLEPQFSARTALGSRTRGARAAAVLLVALSVAYPTRVPPLVAMLSAWLYLASTVDRNLLMLRGLNSSSMIRVSESDARAVPDWQLPRYTVLLPVYDEPAIVRNVLNGVGHLDYPRQARRDVARRGGRFRHAEGRGGVVAQRHPGRCCAP